MRQVPTRLIHALAIKAVLETRPDAVQIAAHAEFGNAVIEIVRGKRPFGVQGGKSSRVSENAMRPFERNKTGFTGKISVGQHGKCGKRNSKCWKCKKIYLHRKYFSKFKRRWNLGKE